MSEEKTPAPAAPVTEFRRSQDFRSVYANNALFEASVWDLKVILGQLDQREGKIAVEQHTAVSIPWTQAKLLSYWLRLNIELYEIEHGKIHIPQRVWPPVAPLTDDPQLKASFELANKIRDEFIAGL
jgi:hypothetical protein